MAHVRSAVGVQLALAKNPGALHSVVHGAHSPSASWAHARAINCPVGHSPLHAAQVQLFGEEVSLNVPGGHWHAFRSGVTHSAQSTHAVLPAKGASVWFAHAVHAVDMSPTE
jgi:hypothetical protein